MKSNDQSYLRNFLRPNEAARNPIPRTSKSTSGLAVLGKVGELEPELLLISEGAGALAGGALEGSAGAEPETEPGVVVTTVLSLVR